MLPRLLSQVCFSEEFGRQMRLITGPRQSGKTTLAQSFLESVACQALYYNWDNLEVRTSYRANPSFFVKSVHDTQAKGVSRPWVCFDEIHKIPKWKNVLKGIFDSYQDLCRFVITGSARMDLLKYTGESLLGRYFTFRLPPLRLVEVAGAKKGFPSRHSKDPIKFVKRCLSGPPVSRSSFDQLINLGGFPEPFLSGSERFLRKWRRDYFDHYIREDLRDLTVISEVEKCFHLIELLPSKIGNPLSLNSLREDLEISHTAVRNWLNALTLTYVVFLISPYSRRLARGVKKEKKCYFFDWGQAADPSAAFENYVAVELLSFCYFLTDSGLGDYRLFFVRTRDGRETDFLITQDGKPWILLEAKLDETTLANHHKLHAAQLGDIPVVQLVKKADVLQVKDKRYIAVSADRFLSNLT